MKFILGFVSRCVQPTLEPDMSLPREEEKSLVGATRRRKRCRVAGEDWRPSLSSISENCTVPKKVQKERRVGVRRKSPKTSIHESHPHVSVDHGRASMLAVIPTFVPTPLIF